MLLLALVQAQKEPTETAGGRGHLTHQNTVTPQTRTWGLTCPVWRRVPVLVVVREAGESRHGTGVVVLDPLDHLPHFLPPLLLFQKPYLLVASRVLPNPTHSQRASVKGVATN